MAAIALHRIIRVGGGTLAELPSALAARPAADPLVATAGETVDLYRAAYDLA